MAKDITIRVTGQNADGTLNVQPVDGANPFMAQSSTAMVPYNPSVGGVQTQPTQGFRARIGSSDVTFASEADFLKTDREFRNMVEQQNVPTVGGGTLARNGIGGGLSWLRTGANAAEAVANFLNGKQIRRKLTDLDDALDDGKAARRELDDLEKLGKYPDLIPILRRALLAERDATESSVSLLEDQLTAVDIQTGAGVAKVASDLFEGSGGTRLEGGTGTALAVGGAGLGLGLLLSNSRDDDRTRRRRR